jgi:hypothetical protein
MTTPTPYPWMEDSQYVTNPVVTGYLAVTSPNGLYLTNGSSTTTITPTAVTSTTFNGALTGTATNLAGGAAGQIPYQVTLNATLFTGAGQAGQLLQSGGTSAPTWVNQNKASSPSGLPTTISANSNQTLTLNFNTSFSSVTRYLVNFTATNTTTQTINIYNLSGGVIGGQYTLVIQLVAAGTGTTTWTFNGTVLASTQKSNFATITTGTMTTGVTKYIVLTFAYDGTNYFISGSNFA